MPGWHCRHPGIISCGFVSVIIRRYANSLSPSLFLFHYLPLLIKSDPAWRNIIHLGLFLRIKWVQSWAWPTQRPEQMVLTRRDLTLSTSYHGSDEKIWIWGGCSIKSKKRLVSITKSAYVCSDFFIASHISDRKAYTSLLCHVGWIHAESAYFWSWVTNVFCMYLVLHKQFTDPSLWESFPILWCIWYVLWHRHTHTFELWSCTPAHIPVV